MPKRFEKAVPAKFVAAKRATGAAELELIREHLGCNRAALGRIYQTSQPDFHRILNGKFSLPERCLPTHRALYLLVTGTPSALEF